MEAKLLEFKKGASRFTQKKLRMSKEGDRIVFPKWKHSGIIKDRSKI